MFTLHPSPTETSKRTLTPSSRVVFVVIIVIFLAFALAFVFLFFLVGFLSKEDIDSYRPTRRV
jgi:hypothetical protein